jgi:hypothetical protein
MFIRIQQRKQTVLRLGLALFTTLLSPIRISTPAPKYSQHYMSIELKCFVPCSHVSDSSPSVTIRHTGHDCYARDVGDCQQEASSSSSHELVHSRYGAECLLWVESHRSTSVSYLQDSISNASIAHPLRIAVHNHITFLPCLVLVPHPPPP